LHVELGRSTRIGVGLAVAHGIAALAAWLTPLPVAVALGGSCVIVGSLIWSLRRHAFRNVKGSVIELDIREDCTVSARLSGEEDWSEYRIDAASFVSAVLTVVSLRSETGRRRVIAMIAGDTLDPNQFRRLRVWLRWRCRKAASAPSPATDSLPKGNPNNPFRA
jgi:toxin CptA